ncbi:type II secretion system F family protein [Populibacterium corticicola]|uniref:Type II secretion system F family protein n=1 Tax=Populibacterium corticicola TaxID=1812826 RepID=A0ABW5XFP1_9MICO
MSSNQPTLVDELHEYEYTVRNAQGKIVSARIEAPNEQAVAGRLAQMGLVPVSIQKIEKSGLNKEIEIGFLKKKIELRDLAVMSRQMATMISAGLSLLRTLSILAEQTENEELGKILTQTRAEVEKGGALSSSFAKHPTVFPPIMINIIRAGETGGFLESALLGLAENFESEVKLKAKIKSAMTYPIVVFIMAILATVGMLLFIVPIFDEMFTSMGGKLPGPTQLLVYMSQIMKWLAPVLAVAFVFFSVWWAKNKHKDEVRSKVDPVKLKAPVFGKLFQKVAIARFTRNFATMLGAGVPILQALDIVGSTAGNWQIEDALKDVQHGVRQGLALSVPMAKHDVFPQMVTQMVAVGEDSGAMETMLSKIADFYDQEVEAATESLTALLEPLMIAFLGVVVGGMIIALYLPIFNIMELVQ